MGYEIRVKIVVTQ